jgi:hypothetical protein
MWRPASIRLPSRVQYAASPFRFGMQSGKSRTQSAIVRSIHWRVLHPDGMTANPGSGSAGAPATYRSVLGIAGGRYEYEYVPAVREPRLPERGIPPIRHYTHTPIRRHADTQSPQPAPPVSHSRFSRFAFRLPHGISMRPKACSSAFLT